MRENLIDYLIDNREYFKEKYKYLLDQREVVISKESPLLHEFIDSNLSSVVGSSMSSELAKATGADMETILTVLEDVDFKEYFK